MYSLKLHKNLSKEKWTGFPMSQRILMIANELNRAKNWIEREDFEEVSNCYERAFELLDLTISTAGAGNLRRELLRFREILALHYAYKQNDADVNQTLFNVLLTLNKDSYNSLN